MTVPFLPTQIFIDQTVADQPMTRHILGQFSNIPHHYVEDPKRFKKPAEMTWAKKGLLLARHKADHLLKSFDAVAISCGRSYFSLDIISNCHLECTYCILQSYLANNPMMTVFTNVDEILEKLGQQLETIPDDAIINTGRIADSLALESVTGWNRILIPFFGALKKPAILELKTKSDTVAPILNLKHKEKTVVSWSMNPQEIVEREEFKTASVVERLNAAKQCLEAGYKIGFHLDPIIHHENWGKNYADLLEQILETIPLEKIAWMSLGILRFPKRQQTIMKKRFPKSTAIHEGLQHSHLPFLSYAENTRKEMLKSLTAFLKKQNPAMPYYTCMGQIALKKP